MKVDFFAREKHHIEHAKAIYDKLQDNIKGDFHTSEQSMRDSTNNIVACFCYGDLKKVDEAGKKAIYGEHGIGMWYNTDHPSYAGSLEHRDCVILRLVPNKRIYEREKEVLKCPIEIIGVPKMDKYHYLRDKKTRIKRKPTIAISFHWDCRVCPETRSSFRYYLSVFRELSLRFKVLGHAHPRIFSQLYDIYRMSGIRPVEDFDEVIKKADVYVCDNSSTIFEFAYTNKPVVLLNCPVYRKNVEHEGNPRFWRFSDIGLQVDSPEYLVRAIEETLENYEEKGVSERQKEITEEMFYSTEGKCGELAAEIIKKYIENYE